VWIDVIIKQMLTTTWYVYVLGIICEWCVCVYECVCIVYVYCVCVCVWSTTVLGKLIRTLEWTCVHINCKLLLAQSSLRSLMYCVRVRTHAWSVVSTCYVWKRCEVSSLRKREPCRDGPFSVNCVLHTISIIYTSFLEGKVLIQLNTDPQKASIMFTEEGPLGFHCPIITTVARLVMSKGMSIHVFVVRIMP